MSEQTPKTADRIISFSACVGCCFDRFLACCLVRDTSEYKSSHLISSVTTYHKNDIINQVKPKNVLIIFNKWKSIPPWIVDTCIRKIDSDIQTGCRIPSNYNSNVPKIYLMSRYTKISDKHSLSEERLPDEAFQRFFNIIYAHMQ